LIALPGPWQWLIAGEWRAHPMRFVLAGLAIAVGVALGFAVHVINRSAADSFGQAVRTASGDADLQVRAASPLGFDERLYPRLFAVPGVADASPVVHANARIGEANITLLGIDMLRALTVTPGLLGRRTDVAESSGASTRAAGVDAVFDPEALFLSQAAMSRTGLRVGCESASARRCGWAPRCWTCASRATCPACRAGRRLP
jgi:putative ABC transport system permease protein